MTHVATVCRPATPRSKTPARCRSFEGAIGDDLDLGEFRGSGEPTARLSLRVEDAYEGGDKIELEVSADTDVQAMLRVESTGTGTIVADEPLAVEKDAWRVHVLAPLPPGAYRLTVVPAAGGQQASDIFVVWTEEAAEKDAAE